MVSLSCYSSFSSSSSSAFAASSSGFTILGEIFAYATGFLFVCVTARVWCRGRIDRKRNSTINLTTDSGACY